jgi:hypothetical protein
VWGQQLGMAHDIATDVPGGGYASKYVPDPGVDSAIVVQVPAGSGRFVLCQTGTAIDAKQVDLAGLGFQANGSAFGATCPGVRPQVLRAARAEKAVPVLHVCQAPAACGTPARAGSNTGLDL